MIEWIVEQVKRGNYQLKLHAAERAIEEIMKCYECGGEMIEKVTSVEMKKEDGSFVIFSDVKVNECRQCGEIYLPAESAEKVGKIMRGEEEKEPTRHVTVPVYTMHY